MLRYAMLYFLLFGALQESAAEDKRRLAGNQQQSGQRASRQVENDAIRAEVKRDLDRRRAAIAKLKKESARLISKKRKSEADRFRLIDYRDKHSTGAGRTQIHRRQHSERDGRAVARSNKKGWCATSHRVHCSIPPRW